MYDLGMDVSFHYQGHLLVTWIKFVLCQKLLSFVMILNAQLIDSCSDMIEGFFFSQFDSRVMCMENAQDSVVLMGTLSWMLYAYDSKTR